MAVVASAVGVVGSCRGHSTVVVVRMSSAATPKLSLIEKKPHASSSTIVWMSWRELARADPSTPRTCNTTHERK